MPELCAANPSVSRKSQTLILQRLASMGQAHVGEAIGKSETWVSRWKSDDSETCASLLACLGLKVVPCEHQCYEPAYIDHLRYFAQIGMAQAPAPKPLEFDE